MLLLKEDGSRKHYRYFWVAAVSRELHWAPSDKPGASGKVERLQSQRLLSSVLLLLGPIFVDQIGLCCGIDCEYGLAC